MSEEVERFVILKVYMITETLGCMITGKARVYNHGQGSAVLSQAGIGCIITSKPRVYYHRQISGV